MNLVEKLQSISDQLNIKFNYGTADALNLLNSTEPDTIYLQLLSPLKRKKTLNTYGSVQKHVWTATMFLLVEGDKTNTTAEQFDGNRERTKYALELFPLYEQADALYDKLRGCGFEITAWQDEETYDVYDVNLSGLVINFTYESYN